MSDYTVHCDSCNATTEMVLPEDEVPAHFPDHWEYVEPEGPHRPGNELPRCPRCLEKSRGCPKGSTLNDFRVTYDADATHDALKTILRRGGREALNLYTFGDLPPDRKGLIAAFHPLVEYTGDFLEMVNETMKRIVLETKQPVFFVMTESKWRLILFGYERKPDDDLEASIWYDDEENGEYTNDQFISHYDIDGKYHFDGAS